MTPTGRIFRVDARRFLSFCPRLASTTHRRPSRRRRTPRARSRHIAREKPRVGALRTDRSARRRPRPRTGPSRDMSPPGAASSATPSPPAAEVADAACYSWAQYVTAGYGEADLATCPCDEAREQGMYLRACDPVRDPRRARETPAIRPGAPSRRPAHSSAVVKKTTTRTNARVASFASFVPEGVVARDPATRASRLPNAPPPRPRPAPLGGPSPTVRPHPDRSPPRPFLVPPRVRAERARRYWSLTEKRSTDAPLPMNTKRLILRRTTRATARTTRRVPRAWSLAATRRRLATPAPAASSATSRRASPSARW